MILYGLKLWSNNHARFPQAVEYFKQKKFDFIELYHNHEEPLEFEVLKLLLPIPVEIHNTHQAGMHTFVITETELAIWQQTLKLADFFNSHRIVVHAGLKHNFESFLKNLKEIDDPRILIENAPACDLSLIPMFGQKYSDLKKISEVKAICLDIPKAASAARAQNIHYQEYLEWCLQELKPKYFHISGRRYSTLDDPVWQHGQLWDDPDIDWHWIKQTLYHFTVPTTRPGCVFETPKLDDSLTNDIKNMDYFRQI